MIGVEAVAPLLHYLACMEAGLICAKRWTGQQRRIAGAGRRSVPYRAGGKVGRLSRLGGVGELIGGVGVCDRVCALG